MKNNKCSKLTVENPNELTLDFIMSRPLFFKNEQIYINNLVYTVVENSKTDIDAGITEVLIRKLS